VAKNLLVLSGGEISSGQAFRGSFGVSRGGPNLGSGPTVGWDTLTKVYCAL